MTTILNSKNDFYKNLISLCKKVGKDFANGKITNLSNEKWCLHRQFLPEEDSIYPLTDKMNIRFRTRKQGPGEVALNVVYSDTSFFVAKQIILITVIPDPSINGHDIVFMIENKVHYITIINGVKQKEVLTLF